MNLEMRRGVHTFTGLVPLGVYMVFHVWEHLPARVDRDLELARLRQSTYAPLEILLVFVPLIVHAVLGLSLSRSADSSRAYASPAFRRMQAATGIAALPFLIWHVAGVWLPRVLNDGGGREALAALRDQVGPMWGMGLYLLGLSAVSIHFGQGLSAVWIRRFPDAPPRTVRTAGVVLGILLWGAMVDVLAVYSGGASLL
jgi:succinate dehydrogenase / fumarate reductase cytochrome b subunit